MNKKHPVEAAIARMSKRDQSIANKLYELGNSDEDFLAAMPSPEVTRLLRQPLGGKKKLASGVNHLPGSGSEGGNSKQENDHESSTAQAPDMGVDVAGILAVQPAGRAASAQAAGEEGTQEPCGHMKRGVRKWYCRRCMQAAYPGVPFEEASRRFRDIDGVPGAGKTVDGGM